MIDRCWQWETYERTTTTKPPSVLPLTTPKKILFLIGLPLILGPSKTLSFFARPQKILGTVTFALGIVLILLRWTFIGFAIELYGLFVLFGDFLATLAGFVGGVPIVGPPVQKALVWIGSAGGRAGGGSSGQNGQLPV